MPRTTSYHHLCLEVLCHALFAPDYPEALGAAHFSVVQVSLIYLVQVVKLWVSFAGHRRNWTILADFVVQVLQI